VARKTRETIILCEAAGYDTVFVETVGVGQSETAVCSMVDFFLLLQIAGAGDELQGIKRGIMEMADGIVINKADGANKEEAQRAAVHYRNALQLFPMPQSGIRPQVLTYSGFYDIGIKEVWDMIYDYIARVKANGAFEKRRNSQAKYWMYETINEQLRNRFYNAPGVEAQLVQYEKALLGGQITSFAAAAKMLVVGADLFQLFLEQLIVRVFKGCDAADPKNKQEHHKCRHGTQKGFHILDLHS
jgi:LAO/AO transport system kinase